MESSSCPYCGIVSKEGKKGIDRHLKSAAKKSIDKRGVHPATGTDEYRHMCDTRRLHNFAKTKEERGQRRYEVQRRYKQSRKERDLDKVRRAFVSLKYVLTCLLVSHSQLANFATHEWKHNVEKPLPLPDVPSFADLVCRYLPSSKWENSDTVRHHMQGNFWPSGSAHSMFDAHHYRLLVQLSACDREQLETSWKEHLRLGQHKRGEDQRRWLWSGALEWGKHFELYNEIEHGLYGSIEEQDSFERKWFAIGLEEAQVDSEWEMFQQIVEMRKHPPLPQCAML